MMETASGEVLLPPGHRRSVCRCQCPPSSVTMKGKEKVTREHTPFDCEKQQIACESPLCSHQLKGDLVAPFTSQPSLLPVHRGRPHTTMSQRINECIMDNATRTCIKFSASSLSCGRRFGHLAVFLKYTLLMMVFVFSQVSSQPRHPSHLSPSHHYPKRHGHPHDSPGHFVHRPLPPAPRYPSFVSAPRDPYLQHHFSLLSSSGYPPAAPSPPQQYHQSMHGYPVRSASPLQSYGPAYNTGDSATDAASLNPASVPSVVKHHGTCTFQRSQPACTFSLLCYLAGGLPVEGCENNIGLTCCMLKSPSKSAFSLKPQPAPSAVVEEQHNVREAPPEVRVHPPPPAHQSVAGPVHPSPGPGTGSNLAPGSGQEHRHAVTVQSFANPSGSVNGASGSSGSSASSYAPLSLGGSSYHPSHHPSHQLANGPPRYPSSYQEYPAYPPNSLLPASPPSSFDSFAYGVEYSKAKQEPPHQFASPANSNGQRSVSGDTGAPHYSTTVLGAPFAPVTLPRSPPPLLPPPGPAPPAPLISHPHPLSPKQAPKSPLSSLDGPVPLAAAQVHTPASDPGASSVSSATQTDSSLPPLGPPPPSSLSLSSSLSVQSPVSSTPHSVSLSSTGNPVLIGATFDDSSVTDNTVRRTIPTGNSIDSNDLTDADFSSARPPKPEDEICGRATMKPRSRIIGGQDAYFGEFPWQVHIKIAKHQCGGALVNRDYVVTAAHCVYQAPLHQLSIIIGAHDIEDPRFQYEQPQYFSVAQVKLHPEFRFSASHPDRFDVAVLRLDKPAKYSSNILPVCLPPVDVSLEGWYGVVTGWGKTDAALSNRYGTRLLQKVDVPIIKNNDCEAWHHTRGIDLKIFPEMFCAGYEDGRKDACVGDSGGPLVVNLNDRWTLAGITSAGFGCAQSRQPGIYHRLPVTVDWVRQNIAS